MKSYIIIFKTYYLVYVLTRLTFCPQKALTCFYDFRGKQLSPPYKTLTGGFIAMMERVCCVLPRESLNIIQVNVCL